MTTTDTTTYYTHTWSPLTSPTPPPDLPAGARVLVDAAIGAIGFDLFSPSFSDEVRDRAYAAMALRPDVTFLVLTGKPGRMREYLCNEAARRGTWGMMAFELAKEQLGVTGGMDPKWEPYHSIIIKSPPLPNVWPGVRLTCQADADRLVPALLGVPAGRRWVMVEPEEPFNIAPWLQWNGVMCPLKCNCSWGGPSCPQCGMENIHLDWVVLRLDEHPDKWMMHWIKQFRRQCRAAGIPLWSGPSIDGELVRQVPGEMEVRP